MGNLFEIVFEDISIENIDSCLKKLTKHGENVLNYNFSSDDKSDIMINFKNDDEIKNILIEHHGGALLINLNELNLESIEIPKCSIRIINYDDKYDLEINFDLVDVSMIDNKLLLNELRIFSSNIAENYRINNYYAGIEPAYDEENRAFTNNELGPFVI